MLQTKQKRTKNYYLVLFSEIFCLYSTQNQQVQRVREKKKINLPIKPPIRKQTTWQMSNVPTNIDNFFPLKFSRIVPAILSSVLWDYPAIKITPHTRYTRRVCSSLYNERDKKHTNAHTQSIVPFILLQQKKIEGNFFAFSNQNGQKFVWLRK